jgi:hypothetical protein
MKSSALQVIDNERRTRSISITAFATFSTFRESGDARQLIFAEDAERLDHRKPRLPAFW